ncbi:MAG: 4-hydroxy-3-methylbut-2-enyl diphosphate reductase [Candidatus Omnitrophica bacterium]|nr:4-hydroxy-3-methylbut-2-enyl diphosphate reductase [Candidatus Omnitrophota bacterium]
MRIQLAKSAGFCFGVKRAIDLALKTASGKNNVYMLGDIVHNEEVVKQIQKAGIKKIKTLVYGKNRLLLMRAHGAGKDIFKAASKLGYKIVDATCPMVKEIHRIAKVMETKKYRIIIIGDKNHEEVLGIVGQLRQKPIVISDKDSLPLARVKKIKKACVVVQSTQNLQKALSIYKTLKSYIPNLRFCNTICRPTRLKQEEIRRMPRENGVMIIIGSKESANTRRLYEISKSLNEKSYWINSSKGIIREWFDAADSVGVSAGASTPDATIQKIVSYLKKI